MADLEVLYTPSLWNNRNFSSREIIENHLIFAEKESLTVRQSLPHVLNVPYGPSPRQQYDLFGTDLPTTSSLVIFIHGGYWQVSEVTKTTYHFIAKNLHNHSLKTAFLGYDLCPTYPLNEIIAQVQKGVQHCVNHQENAPAKGVFVMGHSAGAHLAAVSLKGPNIKGGILLSGVFDLNPLIETTVNGALKLDVKQAMDLSPFYQMPKFADGVRFLCAVGSNESPGFLKQNRDFSEKLKSLGFGSSCLVVENVDHYDIVEGLVDENFSLFKEIIKFIHYN